MTPLQVNYFERYMKRDVSRQMVAPSWCTTMAMHGEGTFRTSSDAPWSAIWISRSESTSFLFAEDTKIILAAISYFFGYYVMQ